jgi:hypothetical protein
MAVSRALAVIVLVAACDSPQRDERRDAPPGIDMEAYVDPDAAPPPFDAALPPEMACNGNNTFCAFPPSQCLGGTDTNYLIYYTGGDCVNDKCAFEQHWLYCYSGCIETTQPAGAYCAGGFT